MSIPIIIVHTGDSFYLEPVLRQARLFNPTNPIYLLSDESTNHYDYVEHINVLDYYALAEDFKKVYVHMSPNPYGYEIFCFLRWFIILDFVKKHNIDHFLCLDSDVLLYCNVDQVFSKWLDYDMAVCQSNGPQYTLFNKNTLNQFCNYILSYYTDKDKFEQVKEWYKQIKFGGICDMTFIKYYAQSSGVHTFDTATIVDNSCFDISLQESQGFEKKGRVKMIYWEKGLPYGKQIETGKLIRFNGLHFQGGVKHRMNKYVYRAEKLSFAGNVWDSVKWGLNSKRLMSRIKEVKKIISNKKLLTYFIKRRLHR